MLPDEMILYLIEESLAGMRPWFLVSSHWHRLVQALYNQRVKHLCTEPPPCRNNYYTGPGWRQSIWFNEGTPYLHTGGPFQQGGTLEVHIYAFFVKILPNGENSNSIDIQLAQRHQERYPESTELYKHPLAMRALVMGLLHRVFHTPSPSITTLIEQLTRADLTLRLETQ